MMHMHGYEMNYVVVSNDEVYCFEDRIEASKFYEEEKAESDKYDLVEMFENTKGLASS